MDSIPNFLMTFGHSLGTAFSENPILLVAGIVGATAIWRFSSKPSRQD